MGSQKHEQDLSFVGMSTGSRGVRARPDSMQTEPLMQTKGVTPLELPEDNAEAQAEREASAKAAQEEAEQRLREKIREELEAEQAEALAAREAEIREEVRAELEAEMEEEMTDKQPGLAKASPDFEEIKPKADASEADLDDAIEENSQDAD